MDYQCHCGTKGILGCDGCGSSFCADHLSEINSGPNDNLCVQCTMDEGTVA